MQVPVPHALALAEQYRQSGHRAVAEDLCRQVLQVRPRDPEALHLMAIMAHQGGDLVAAIDYLKRAIAAKGNVPLFLSNLCEMCRQAGRLDEAIVAGTRAIKLHPNYPPALNNLAIAHFDREEFSTAERYCRRALALDPSFAEAHNNLANALRAQHKFEQSIPGYNRAIELSPGYADAIANLGSVLHIVGKLDEAMSTFRWALALDPRQADARTGVGILQLLNANFEAGWSDYEWRLLTQQSRHRTPPGPVWDGSNPAGRRILVYGEQGFGDALQFCRYLPMLIERGATVALAIPSAVAGLIAESIPGLEVWSSGTLPSYDCHCALLSLPHRFGTRSGSIPRPIAYLRPPREAIARWASRIVGPELKVGLVWTGNPKHVNNPGRSTTADSLLPLLSIEGIRFFSLQVGASAGELTKLSKGSVPDLSPDLTDYSETAGAVANLDLVVTIDTSVAHLTGAIGKPAWVILSSVPDWRWMLDREDNPWYPTMRLFRPQAPRDWSGVIERVAAELRAVLGGDRSRLTPFLRSSG
jgi:tetratricopeptide (TPR) repeat protein